MRNGGGNSDVIHPLMDALKAHRQWKGQIFVLIGPETFSAAVMAALRMKDELHATLVGEAAGGKPGFYGFPGFVTLPNSQLVIRFTTKYTPAPAGMDRPVLIPDIPASMSTADLFAGRDPALDAAIAAR
jgi:C-terminal processing protease CtpA/Prc